MKSKILDKFDESLREIQAKLWRHKPIFLTPIYENSDREVEVEKEAK